MPSHSCLFWYLLLSSCTHNNKKDVGNDGDSKNDYVEVEVGLLDTHNKMQIEDATGREVDFFRVDGNPEGSTELYEFLADNSNVEWFQVQYGDDFSSLDKSYTDTVSCF